jgi:tetrahydrodipicolinate N-succinyltransferase
MQNVSNNPTDIDSWQNLSWTTQEVDAKLFPRPNKNNGIPFTEVDRVNKSRHELFEDSARTGTALAETRQATVKKAHDAVKQINHNSMQSKNLHDDLTVNNQAQVVMANELIQIRQLLAKQLELMAALHLKVYSEYSAPANLHRDKKEEAKKEQARIKRQQEFERELRQRIARVPTRL